ncbi:MAG: hypothetical protein ACREK8_02810, partial [Gemmatimonadales bacterium]
MNYNSRVSRVFLLSPASLSGRRAALLFNPDASFDLAVRIRAAGVPLGEIFSFISGLYFRGKVTYARRFSGPGDAVRIITSNRGLLDPDTPVTLAELRAMAESAIDHTHEPYRAPVARDAVQLAELLPGAAAVLLGSVATDKYVAVLHEVFAERLLFPPAFAGRGDMSRGGLMLRCAREGVELDYTPVMTTARRGTRPPRLAPLRRASRGAVPIEATMKLDGRSVTLTNLDKIYWPREKLTKRDLLAYYLSVADVLLPHLRDRAMVMKRYPNGIAGKCFFMKRAPTPRPDWIATCSITHRSGNVIDFPLIQDRSSLLWCVNLGCIDLNPWYTR